MREEYLQTQFFPQPSTGLQLTHNQSISKGLASVVDRLSQILINLYWIHHHYCSQKSWIHARKKTVNILLKLPPLTNLCKPNIFPDLPQPSIGLQLTHNQSPKASPLLSVANLKSWVISIEIITTSIHKHLESMQEKQWLFSSGCYHYKPNFFPSLQNLQLCSNSHTTKSPKTSLTSTSDLSR